MARRFSLSTSRGARVNVWGGFGDGLHLLDVLYADHFENHVSDPAHDFILDENFYKGAPPDWLNFHINEQAASAKKGTPFVTRDGYEKLKKQIKDQEKRHGISTVKLFHQSGSGGTTLAMQVLWDLRKNFRCAVLTSSASDVSMVAEQVVQLFTAGNNGSQNTVLLLLNNEEIIDKLEASILKTIADKNIVTHMSVAIFLTCVRKDAPVPQNQHVVLKRELSATERGKFDEKKKELEKMFGKDIEHLHGFNIMQTNFSKVYIEKACEVFRSSKRANRPLKNQLAAFLALLNTYVPGSYLLESQCLDFLNQRNYTDKIMSQPLENRMKPFGHLIITFQQDQRSERKVRMAHPMIAKCCTELLAEAEVKRSDTARNFLNNFCSNNENNEFPPCLLGFVKDMLTKRETITADNLNSRVDQEKFSKLILDIQKENKKDSASVLKVASKKFDQNPFFPQALARFYYIELKHYGLAKKWAIAAMERDPQNSFVADTLGQVYKNQLKNMQGNANPREILQLAKKAIDAFKHEEQLSEEEHESTSHSFNYRGQFGFLQVANLLYDLLNGKNPAWKEVLANDVSFCPTLKTLGDTKLYRFDDLIRNLKEDVEIKSEFLEKLLTYSKLTREKDYPEYMSRETFECHRKYVEDLAASYVGVLSSLNRGCSEDELIEITYWWKRSCSRKDSGRAVVSYILSSIMLINTSETFSNDDDGDEDHKISKKFRERVPLSDTDPPEEHMLALLLHWPTDNEGCQVDLSKLIQQMSLSYERAYSKYFRSKYLCPLFFIGKGKHLKRFVHRNILEKLFEQSHETNQDWNNTWRNEKMFKDNRVREHLLNIEGEVCNYKVYATVGGKRIEMEANLKQYLWKPRQVSFYLGFTIRGPVAFGIQTKKTAIEANNSACKDDAA